MEADGYWWPGFRQVSDCKLSVDASALELLERVWEKLLQGCQFFKGPDAACRKAISSDTEQVRLMGKLRKLDKSLSGATDRISEILGLNEIQSYCLLKQFAKSNEVDSKHLTSLTGDQLDDIQNLYMTERRALLRCVLWAMQLREECESSRTEVGKKLREKLGKMVEKGWGQNILNDLKYALNNHFEASPSGPATLGDAELDLLLEILSLHYQTDPPDSKEIVELVESLKKFGLGAMLQPSPWELCTKVWHLFMYALDFPAMLDCVVEGEGGNPHRLVGSLKEIDGEVQELMKCKDNIVGVVMMAWALFIRMEKRSRSKKGSSKMGSEKRSRTADENTVDPLVYFGVLGQDYIFAALGKVSEVSRELPVVEKNVLEGQVVVTIAAVIVVAEKLLLNREALDHIIKLLLPILEGQGASSCGGSITREILSNPRYGSVLELFHYLQLWFPAIPSPYLKFLGALCGENMVEGVASAFELPSVTLEHLQSDGRVRNISSNKVEALHSIDNVDYLQIKQGTQGHQVHSPVRLESKMLVKWYVEADVFQLMEGKLNRTMSRENAFSVFDKDCQEAADMFRMFKRIMECPRWIDVFKTVTEKSETDTRSFHLKWLLLALHGVEWFAEMGSVEPLADCISIMSSYTSLLPSQVWNAVLRSKFLCPSPSGAGGRHINSLLEGVWNNQRDVGVVAEYVKLTGNLMKQGILGHHVKANAARILDKVLLGRGGGTSIDSDLTKDIFNMVIVILTSKWCSDEGFSQEVISHLIHRRGVFQLLLDGTLPQPLGTTQDQQSEQKNRRLAAVQLNLVNTLLSQDTFTQKIVAETLLQPVKGGQTVRFVILLSYMCLPKEELVPGSIEVLVHFLNQQLGVEIWTKLLAVVPSKAILLESLMPSAEDQDFSGGFPEIRETVCQAFQQTNAVLAQNLFSSVIDLLIEAGRHHRPTYQMLLLPSKLQPECSSPSALDGLLDIVKDSKKLLESHPRVVYDCMRGIHCIWTYRRDWPPPVSLMTVQQGFWQSLTHILKDTTSVNANKYRASSAAIVLEILAMESEDGWSGQSGVEAKKLWIASGGESQWSLLRNTFSSCALPSDPTVYLLSAANEVALDILQQLDTMDPDTRIPLLEKLERAAVQDLIDMKIPDAGENALIHLRHSAGRDPHQRPGLVLLTELNAGLDIWSSSSDTIPMNELTEHRLSRIIPPSLSCCSDSMDLLWKLLRDAGWLNSMLCSKIAGLRALHQLAFSHWTEPSGSVSLSTKSASVTTTSQAITPWLEISKGVNVGLRPPVVFSGQLLPIQESDIKRKALQIAQSLAASMLFFVQEWCDGIAPPPRSTSKSRTRSPTPRARSRSGSLARQDSRVEDLAHIGAIDAVFRCVGIALAGIQSGSMRLWIGGAKDTIGAILSTVATILVEYPFRSRGGRNGRKQLPGEVEGALGKETIAGLCHLVDKEEEPVTAAIVSLGLLLQYDVWPDATLIVLRQNLDLQGLLTKAMQSIPTFAQKKGKECPREHWSSAALGFCYLVAERCFVRDIFLLPETLKTLVEYGKMLLDTETGGLGTPDVMLDSNPTDGQEMDQADFRGAYDAETGRRRVEHEQWLMFLAIMECTLRKVGHNPPNFEANLMAEFQCAMLKAFEVPFANHIEPLTHAQLQETISALRFLSAGWKSCNPVSLLALRKAVSHFVDSCGSGNPSPASFYCPPVSFEEQAASREKSPIGGHYGWFHIFAIGERTQGNDSEAREEPAVDSGSKGQRARTPSLPAQQSSGADAFQTPRHSVLHRRESSQNMGRSDGRLVQDQVNLSLYSFMLGHSMYTSLNLALEFLLSSTPSVSSNEASAVCPGLSKESLLALRQECLDLGTNVSHWEMEDPRVAQVIYEVRDIVRMATELLVVLGHTPRRRETERIENSLVDLERCLEECRS